MHDYEIISIRDLNQLANLLSRDKEVKYRGWVLFIHKLVRTQVEKGVVTLKIRSSHPLYHFLGRPEILDILKEYKLGVYND